MRTLPPDITLRRPALDDAQAVVNLMNTCDIAEYGESDSSLEDLLDQWGEANLDEDAWLACTPGGQLAGYAAVFGGRLFSYDLYTPPAPYEPDLNIHLLQQCEARALRQLAEAGSPGEREARIFISHVNLADQQAAEAMGYTPQHYHFRMQIDFDAPPPAPAWPEEVTLRTIVPGQEDHKVYEFIQAAFERPGRVPPTFEAWRDFMMRPNLFDPNLWWLVFHQEELIGANLCFDYPQYGWVRQLGVAAAWRKHGLGAALLTQAFDEFYRRGHPRVALGVDSENPRAVHFYEGVGMKCVRQFDEYRKTLIAGQ